MSEPERIIIRPGGVGDTLLLAPALSRLRETSEACVTLVGYPSRLEPLVHAGLAHRTVALDDFLADTGIQSHSSRVDAFFSSLPDHFLAHPDLLVHTPFPPENSRRHVAEYLADCLEVSLQQGRSSPLRCLLRETSRNHRPILWIHPGSGGKQKRWPLSNYIEIAADLSQKSGNGVVFLLGEAEEDLEGQIRRVGFEVRQPASIKDLCSYFTAGDRFLGNDSGPTHLAALMGLDTLAVFGPTDPTVWGPWGDRAAWASAEDGEKWIEPCKVLEKVRHWWFDPTS
jgi:heptosyltransferase III